MISFVNNLVPYCFKLTFHSPFHIHLFEVRDQKLRVNQFSRRNSLFGDSQATWDENMHQEKKIIHGKFFDFCAEKCI